MALSRYQVYEQENEKKFDMKYQRILPYLVRFSDHFFRRHKVHSEKKQLSCTPFFILGSGRNGSTLLSAMINQHSKIMIPPEQWILYEMIIKYKLLNFLEWKDLVNILVGLLANKKSNEGWDTDFGEIYSSMHHLPQDERTLQTIIDTLFLEHGNQHNVEFEVWGDKSPLNTIYLDYIYPVYPDSKYIFLLRDGRDVASSMSKVRKKNLQYGVWRWNYAIQQMEWLVKKIPSEQFHLVLFKDLVLSPVETLTNLVEFLGYSFENKMLEYQGQVDYLGVQNMKYHKNVQQELSSELIGKWKERLSNDEIDQIMPFIGKNLEKYGFLD